MSKVHSGESDVEVERNREKLDVKPWLEENSGDLTLLGICPLSEEVVKASMLEASEKEFLPMFVATPRQVDADRGYTGWSQSDLIDFIEFAAQEAGFEGPYIVARDHGGPYQTMRDRGDPEVDLEEAMSYAKEIFMEDIRSGFDIIHVDATEDPRIGGILELDEIVVRTAELISYVEGVQEEENLPEVYYEVGTEEISGGLTEPENFEGFIDSLIDNLESRGLAEASKRLLFIVGQVGTDMTIDMKNQFKPNQASTLVDIASSYGLFLKVHYTDWLDDSDLERFPELGIGGANVGPEFGSSMVKGLIDLEKKENEVLSRLEENVESSNIVDVIEKESVKDAPWQKFAPEDLEGYELDEYAQEHRREIALCVGRYVMGNPEIKNARRKLYENLKNYGSLSNPNKVIIRNIRSSIARYVKDFNLIGSSKR